jgi:hypothetical protein
MAALLGIEIALAAAKIGKYASSESGDTLEVVERPHGGISAVLADGQRSGKGAKRISNLVVRKAVALLADGVRDGAAARAAHDYLRTHRSGQVSSTLDIVSVDLDSQTLVISRNSHCPVLLFNPAWITLDCPDGLRLLDEASEAIGVHARTKPVITELPLLANTTVIVFTDGVWTAGERYGQRLDVAVTAQRLMSQGYRHPQALADRLLAEALALDQGRPADDMSLLVLAVLPREQVDEVRRLAVTFPL